MGKGASKLSDVTALSDAEIKALGFRETEYETFVTGKVFLTNNKEMRRSKDYKAHRNHFSNMRDYQYQRAHLRRALTYTFFRDSRYSKLLDRVRGFKEIVCRDPELCRTAREELALVGQFQPTCVESVYKELERLYGIYETDRMAKSLVSRVGPAACPLGHHAGYFDTIAADVYHPELQKRLERAERRTTPGSKGRKSAAAVASGSKDAAGGGSGSDSELSSSSKSSNKGAAASQKGKAPGSPNASKKESSPSTGGSILLDNNSLTTTSTKGTFSTAATISSNSRIKMAIMMSASERLIADFKVICRICDQNTNQGYHCSYCDYDVCAKCAPMYCKEGHICKLWTNPEADLACFVCSAGPLMAGYHCNECMDFDLCDRCSYREPRKHIQSIILKEREELVEWVRSKADSSETAYNAMKYNATDYTTDPCPTTLYHFTSLKYYRDCKKQIEWELIYDILKKEIKALRNIYLVNMEHCKTVLRSAVRPVEFSEDEKARLTECIKTFERARSEQERSKAVVGCPLGHAMFSYDIVPDTYRAQPEVKVKSVWDDDFAAPEVEDTDEREKDASATEPAEDMFVGCSLCHRIAHDGYHCSLCEFELCMTCRVIHCDKGHSQGIWTVPEAADVSCHYCGMQNITSGYHCTACDTDMCDFCTRLDRRRARKRVVEQEIKEMMDYMIENKRNSDVARYYQWRRVNYVVSEGYLYEYACEMRLAFYRARKQVKYKELILEMKDLRKGIIEKLPKHLCKVSADEQLALPLYYFDTKKEAVAERNRLKAILDADFQMKTIKGRSSCMVACPQGHGMIPTLTRPPRIPAAAEADEEGCAAEAMSDSSSVASSRGSVVSALSSKRSMLASMQKAQEKAKAKLEPKPVDPNERLCKICFDNPAGGNICVLCDYELCKPCSTLNCRAGHECIMWTVPEAYGLSCDVCKYPDLKAGYRCGTCKTDICDTCTQIDSRNSLKLGPRKEVKKLVMQLEMLRDRSEIAAFYYARHISDKDMVYARTMNKLCVELRDLRGAKEQAEKELQHKIHQQSLASYAYTASDL